MIKSKMTKNKQEVQTWKLIISALIIPLVFAIPLFIVIIAAVNENILLAILSFVMVFSLWMGVLYIGGKHK